MSPARHALKAVHDDAFFMDTDQFIFFVVLAVFGIPFFMWLLRMFTKWLRELRSESSYSSDAPSSWSSDSPSDWSSDSSSHTSSHDSGGGVDGGGHSHH